MHIDKLKISLINDQGINMKSKETVGLITFTILCTGGKFKITFMNEQECNLIPFYKMYANKKE